LFGNPANEQTIVMFEVTIKGDLLNRGIKRASALINPGRRVISNKTTEAWHNYTIMTE
jgi:hypothetical protein